MNGTLHQKNILKAYPISWPLVIEMLIPFVLGMAAIITHAKLRLHLGIPGHQGIIFMALLITACKTSKLKWSAMFFSAGVGSMLYIPFLGFNDPFVALVYLWPGILFDFIYNTSPTKHQKIWFILIIGGLAYSTIPGSRFILGIITGNIHKSVMNGPVFPFLLFFIFGLIGTMLGIGANYLLKKIFSNRNSTN